MILFFVFIFSIASYRLCYPPKITGIHQSAENVIVLVVKHFPWTKAGKIKWWQKNQVEILSKLNTNKGDYSVFVYNANYQKDSGTDKDSDLLCFREMVAEENCISKENRPLIIWHYHDGHTEYKTESIFRRFY